jgi:hypothetical protein
MCFRNIFKALFLFAIVQLDASGQTQDVYEYQSEFVWGINKNTSGGLIGGFVFKKSRKLSDRMLETFGLEIMNVKHPQEVRRNSVTGNFFIYGKNNYLYSFRLQYGRDLILFRKAPQQGVEIKAVFAVGPSIGVVAPYYIEWAPDGGGYYTVREQYYDLKETPEPEIPAEYILGPGRLFEGLGDSKIKFGANAKAALNFELGVFKSQVTGFEAGVLVDAYTSKIEMVPTAKNYSAYPTLFLTFFYGTRK